MNPVTIQLNGPCSESSCGSREIIRFNRVNAPRGAWSLDSDLHVCGWSEIAAVNYSRRPNYMRIGMSNNAPEVSPARVSVVP